MHMKNSCSTKYEWIFEGGAQLLPVSLCFPSQPCTVLCTREEGNLITVIKNNIYLNLPSVPWFSVFNVFKSI